MTPIEVDLLREMWADYRTARRKNKGRWLAASRLAARRVRMAKSVLRDAHDRWAKEA